MLLGESLEGKLIRALAMFGPKRTEELLPSLRKQTEIQWKAIASVSAQLPTWLAQIVCEEARLAGCCGLRHQKK